MSTVLLLLVVSLLCGVGHSQDIELLTKNLKQHLANRQALDHNPSAMLEAVSDAASELEQLWDVYLPDLLDSLAAENGNDSLPISAQCLNSTIEVLANHHRPNVRLPELVPLLDATGKQGAGLLGGNMGLDGAFDECFDYNYTGFCKGSVSLTAIKPTLVGMFRWTLGLCVPKGCNATDVALVMNYTRVFSVNESLMSCSDTKRPSYSPGAVVMLLVVAIFVVLVLVGTLVDKIQEWVRDTSQTRNILSINEDGDSGKGNGVLGVAGPGERVPLLGHTVENVKRSRVNPLEFITAFSLYKTVPTLLATKQAASVITSLNGLRVISMFWVILGHAYVWILSSGLIVDNPLHLLNISARLSFQPVGNAFLAVDSFFFLSGVLVAYLTFRQMERSGRFPFLHYYLHRYLRLTPVYAFVLFFAWFLGNHIAPGPEFAFGNGYAKACSKYWWTNLLYINNLYPWKLTEGCVNWSWYLANDMQFFVIAPLVLIPLYHLLPVGLVAAGILLFCSFFVTGFLTGWYNFQASIFAFFAYGYYSTGPQMPDVIYTKPWARIQPYIVGLLLGYLFFKKVRLPFSRTKNAPLYLGLWVLAGTILFPTVYGLYFVWNGHIPTKVENIFYITFSRFGWGVGLALLVFACHNGYGGLINTILSFKAWTPLARITYNAYLVHPIVCTVVYGQMQKTFHCTDITVAALAVAFVVFSYAAGAVLCVCVEFPLGTVEMLVFKLLGLGGRDTLRQGTGAAVGGRGGRGGEAGEKMAGGGGGMKAGRE